MSGSAITSTPVPRRHLRGDDTAVTALPDATSRERGVIEAAIEIGHKAVPSGARVFPGPVDAEDFAGRA